MFTRTAVGKHGLEEAAALKDRYQLTLWCEAAHRRVREEYLAPRRLIQELDLIDRIAG